jgi:drug/metabolite transporter (DMT)-like permease
LSAYEERYLSGLADNVSMDGVLIGFLIAMGLALMDVLADFLIKEASLKVGFTGWGLVLIGGLIYALTAIGVFLVLRKLKLSTASVVFSVTFLIFVTLLSVFYFKEALNYAEMFAIAMAVTSLIILYRFA